MPETKTKREPKWDNAKFFLIVCVVIGHSINKFTKQDQPYTAYQSLFLFIYTFHMPAFIFLSGLMQKSFVGKELDINRIFFFVRIAILANVCNWLGHMGNSSLFLMNSKGIAWFMYAMAAFILITWCMRNMNPVYVLLFSIVFSLLMGYDSFLSSTFCFSQVIYFYPFYYLGYLLDPKKVLNFLEKRSVKISSVLILAVIAFTCVTKVHFCHSLRGFLTATMSYAQFSKIHATFLHRIACYVIQALSSCAILSLIPAKNLGLITLWGKRTLSVYLFHRGILFALTTLKVDAQVRRLIGYRPFLIVWVLGAICLACILSTGIFENIFQLIANGKLPSKKAKL